MGEGATGTDRIENGEAVQILAEILQGALAELAGTGKVETACRLAGRACVALRRGEPTLARRFDVLLHRLTPKLTW